MAGRSGRPVVQPGLDPPQPPCAVVAELRDDFSARLVVDDEALDVTDRGVFPAGPVEQSPAGFGH